MNSNLYTFIAHKIINTRNTLIASLEIIESDMIPVEEKIQKIEKILNDISLIDLKLNTLKHITSTKKEDV